MKLPVTKRRIVRLFQNLSDSFQYRLSRHRNDVHIVKKVVFVCKGNICRSPFAERLLRQHAPNQRLLISSCGLAVGSKKPPPRDASRVAIHFGLDLAGHLSTQADVHLLAEADLIVAMEFKQYRELRQLLPAKVDQIRLLKEFSAFPGNILCNIYDPYGGTDDDYALCFSQIRAAVKGMLVVLRREL